MYMHILVTADVHYDSYLFAYQPWGRLAQDLKWAWSPSATQAGTFEPMTPLSLSLIQLTQNQETGKKS